MASDGAPKALDGILAMDSGEEDALLEDMEQLLEGEEEEEVQEEEEEEEEFDGDYLARDEETQWHPEEHLYEKKTDPIDVQALEAVEAPLPAGRGDLKKMVVPVEKTRAPTGPLI